MQGDAYQLVDLEPQRRATAALRDSMAKGAERISIRGYELLFRPAADVFYRSVALPVSQDCRDIAAIAALERNFRKNKRQPKIEFLQDLFPRLESALTEQGWQIERKAEAMQLSAPDVCWADEPVEWLHQSDDDEQITGFLAGMARAYGASDAIARSEILSLRSGLADGRIQAAFRRQGIDICAGAALSIAHNTAELQGVWTAKTQRRKGMAQKLCRQLLKRFLNHADCMVWLSVGGPESLDLYRKLGFRPLGTQINMHLL